MLDWLLGKKGLSGKEVEKALAKIRAEYDHYIVHFQKPPRAKEEFEARYRKAHLGMMDMTFFLNQEIKILQGLIQKAEEEAQERQWRETFPKPDPGPRKSYADRVLEQLQKAIEPYPSRRIHPEANLDVDKLYGALEWLSTSIWPLMLPHLRALDPVRARELDEALCELIPGGGKLGKEEEVYKALLTSKAPLNRIALQQKELILRAAFWLHRSRDLLRRGQDSGDARIQEVCLKALAFWDRIIADFRLKYLKPPPGAERGTTPRA